MKIDARFAFDKVRFDQEADTHLVVSLTAPTVDTDIVRPKLAMMVCIDTSSSMAGQKIAYAKLSVQKLIDHLKPDDYLGIVSFSSSSHVIAPLSRLTPAKKDELRKLVAELRAAGGTNFAGGMLQGIEQLKDADLGSHHIHRVIMFTDGQANAGPATKPADIIRFFKANAPDYITASAFGYGHGAGDFDASFLTDFAKEARGNYAHVEDPDKALQAFGTELGGLISTFATNIRLVISPLGDHKIAKVISDVDAEEDATGDVTITVPDILAEETRHLVLAFKVAKQRAGGPRPVNVVGIRTMFDTFDPTGKKEERAVEVKGKLRFVKEGDEQQTPTSEVEAIAGLALLVRAQLDAEQQAKRGDFAAASQIMEKTATHFAQNGNAQLAAMSQSVRHRLADSASYTSNQAYLQGMSRGMTRGVGGFYSAEVQQDLTNFGVQLSNSYQTSTSTSFTAGAAASPPEPPVVSPNLGIGSMIGYVSPGPGTGDAGGAYLNPNFAAVIGPALADPDFSVVIGHSATPVPTHETDSAGKSKDKPAPARKPVRQTRSKKSW